MKKLIFLIAILLSMGVTAQDLQPYLAVNVGASFSGGELLEEVDPGTGLDFNLNAGLRVNVDDFPVGIGAVLTYGASASSFEDDGGDTAGFGAGYLGAGPLLTLEVVENFAWDIKPQYVFSLAGVLDYEGGDFDATLKGSGWMLGQSFVFGTDQGFKFSVNLDYLSGKYDSIEVDGESIDIDSDNSYSHFTIGVGARYNF
ncbi:hypothetical protein N9J65_01275 [Flavobacteriaceae bacterium]|nr:hypothetical protein [Flavobacteriaceae bacterium]